MMMYLPTFTTLSSFALELLEARVLLVFVVTVLLAGFMLQRPRHRNLPPGPWSLPVVGASFRLGKNHAKTLYEISLKYGNVYSIRLWQGLVVVISDPALAKEAFLTKGDVSNGRVRDKLESMKGSIVYGDCPKTRKLRRVVLRALRDIGLGKTKVAEAMIGEEANTLCQSLVDNQRRYFDPRSNITMAVSNIICQLCFGKRFHYDNEQFLKMVHSLKTLLAAASPSSGTKGRLFRTLAYLVAKSTKRFRAIMDSVMYLNSAITGFVIEHKESFDVNDIRDVIDVLLDEKRKPDDGIRLDLEDQDMFHTIIEMFSAGTDTTGSTIGWAILYMALNGEISNRVRNEISDQIGLERLPRVSDRSKLPYTYATIYEVLRISHPVPLGVSHRTMGPMELAGYTIPKDTTILLSQWAMARNTMVWKEPFEFNPSRFMSDDGKTMAPCADFIPFGIGPRACLGENLANIELFIFFTTLMQRFTFELPPGEPLPSLEGQAGMTYGPSPYRVRAIPNQ